MDRLSARLEERDDPVRAALPGTIQHWNLSLNPPHTRNSGYLPFVSKSAVTQARQRLGHAPIAWLFEQ
ncbi:transposase domain-containing protein, partial [Burkholderia multivorans]|uniref:transposase domain-containing protein n=1 Tax=Burkholderia multivorans TaxID=87883 RepID=UPI0039BF3DAC